MTNNQPVTKVNTRDRALHLSNQIQQALETISCITLADTLSYPDAGTERKYRAILSQTR